MNLKRINAAIALIVLILSCTNETPTLTAPSIESISFDGIASQDVELNQTLRSVTITMPAVLVEAKLKYAVQLTPHTEIISGLLPDGTLDLSSYCPCADVSNRRTTSRAAKEIVLRNTQDGREESYWLILRTRNPLVIKSSTTPLTYSISDKSTRGIVVPVENYYGSQPARSYGVINTVTGKSAFTDNDGGCASDCSPVGASQMAIYLNFFLRDFPYGFEPGTYAVQFTLEDGTIMRTPQPIQVTP